MLACRDAAELVTDYLERALPPRTRLDLRWHLFRCEMCRNYYAQMRATVALLRRVPAPTPSAGTEEELIAARAREPRPPGAPDDPA